MGKSAPHTRFERRSPPTAASTVRASAGVEQQPDGSFQSQALFQVDRFALINIANNVTTAPFVVQNGQTFISQALIGTGWIQNAMIGDVIQSTAVGVGGQPRWKLDKNASLTMRGVNSNGGYMELTDSALRFWNSTGSVALVELGSCCNGLWIEATGPRWERFGRHHNAAAQDHGTPAAECRCQRIGECSGQWQQSDLLLVQRVYVRARLQRVTAVQRRRQHDYVDLFVGQSAV